MTTRIIQGAAQDILATLPERSVHMCVTSPPYWAQRRYTGADAAKALGNEPTPEVWAQNLVEVFRGVKRVLRDDGTLWLNCGDKYAGSGGSGGDYNEGGLKASANGTGPSKSQGINLPGKNLIGLPWRLAFALQADGWILRSDIIWHKPSPMPQSVTDRPTTAHEYLFLLTKQPRYFYDAEAVREKGDGATADVHPNVGKGERTEGRNARSVQSFAPSPFNIKHLGKYGPMPDVDHHALFPISLPTWCIKAGTSERGCCPDCGAPWVRQVQTSGGSIGRGWHNHDADPEHGQRVTDSAAKSGHDYKVETTGWAKSCACPTAEPIACTVLDPFAGAGTTILAAEQLGRNSIGIELSESYIRLAQARLRAAAPMLTAQA